jgi:hypothetical protein
MDGIAACPEAQKKSLVRRTSPLDLIKLCRMACEQTIHLSF